MTPAKFSIDKLWRRKNSENLFLDFFRTRRHKKVRVAFWDSNIKNQRDEAIRNIRSMGTFIFLTKDPKEVFWVFLNETLFGENSKGRTSVSSCPFLLKFEYIFFNYSGKPEYGIILPLPVANPTHPIIFNGLTRFERFNRCFKTIYVVLSIQMTLSYI